MPQQSNLALAPGQFRAYIFSLEGRAIGAFKRSARWAGLSLDQFVDMLDSGQKRCTRCKAWKPMAEFGVDVGRWDGLDPKCLVCHRLMGRERYVPVPMDQHIRMGPPRHDPRDGDKVQARHLVNMDVRRGYRPHPNTLFCVRCGHRGPDRRHEYHHHMGYAAAHHYDVIPLCTTCHHEES